MHALAMQQANSNLTSGQLAIGGSGLALLALMLLGFYMWKNEDTTTAAAAVFVLIGAMGGIVATVVLTGAAFLSKLVGG